MITDETVDSSGDQATTKFWQIQFALVIGLLLFAGVFVAYYYRDMSEIFTREQVTDIQEAALRYYISKDRWSNSGQTVCVALRKGTGWADIPPSLANRFSDIAIVKPDSDCTVDPKTLAVYDNLSGQYASRVLLGEIHELAPRIASIEITEQNQGVSNYFVERASGRARVFDIRRISVF